MQIPFEVFKYIESKQAKQFDDNGPSHAKQS